MKKTAVVLLLLSVGIGGAMLFRKPHTEAVSPRLSRPFPASPENAVVASKNQSGFARNANSPVQGVPALPAKPRRESRQSQPRRPAVLQPGARPPLPQLSQFEDAGDRAVTRSEKNAVSQESSPAVAPNRGQVSKSMPGVINNKGNNQILTIVNGDTLERIARRYLGNATWANAIYQINQDQIADPNRLPLGKKILIPLPEQLPTRLSSSNPPVKELVPLPQWTINDSD